MAFCRVLPDMADTPPNCQHSEKLTSTIEFCRGRPETEHHWPCHHKRGWLVTFWSVQQDRQGSGPLRVSSRPLQGYTQLRLPNPLYTPGLGWSGKGNLTGLHFTLVWAKPPSQPGSKSLGFLPHTLHEILELGRALIFLHLAQRLTNTLSIGCCLGSAGS